MCKKSWTRVNKNTLIIILEAYLILSGPCSGMGSNMRLVIAAKRWNFNIQCAIVIRVNFLFFFVLTKSKFCSVWCGDWDWLGRREREKRDYFMRWLLVSGIVTSLSLYSEWPPTQNHLCAKCWNSERFQMNWLDLGQARNSQFFQVV